MKIPLIVITQSLATAMAIGYVIGVAL